MERKNTVYQNFLGMTFIHIKPFNFSSGPFSSDPSYKDSPTANDIFFSKEFYMQDTVVTVGQYFHFIQETNYPSDYKIEYWTGQWKVNLDFLNANSRGKNKPIIGVSYYDVIAFIQWLENKEGVKYRICTEAEFEFSAKGNCRCFDTCYNIEKLDTKYFRTSEQEKMYPRAVKFFPPNLYGLYDMNGCVWQWCEDWYSLRSNSKIDGNLPNITKENIINWNDLQYSGDSKVIRGGSFSYPKMYSSCTNRHFSYPHDRNHNLGFRLVIDF